MSRSTWYLLMSILDHLPWKSTDWNSGVSHLICLLMDLTTPDLMNTTVIVFRICLPGCSHLGPESRK